MSEALPHIGFPAGVLEERPVRLPVFHHCEGMIALEKPHGVLIDADPWYHGRSTLVGGIRLQAGKPELERLGVGESVKAIYNLEPKTPGIAILATTPESTETLRNEYGSEAWEFTFHLLARDHRPGKGTTRECDLPLAKHFDQDCMVVSHKTGKKSKTTFNLIAEYGPYSLWEAKTNYLRPHSIRLHAYEVGLGIVGEYIYGKERPILLSKLKGGRFAKKEEEKPLYDGVALEMLEVKAPSWTAQRPLIKRFGVMLKHLKRYC